jgi:hypothetical protein
MATISFELPNKLTYDFLKDTFTNCTKEEMLKYYKGLYTNFERFNERFIKDPGVQNPHIDNLRNWLLENYERAIPFTYAEAFALKNEEFKHLVFGSINIEEMIENLGYQSLKSETINVNRKQFSAAGESLDNNVYDTTYETLEVFGEKLGIENNVYAIKCTCPSTKKTHYIWIDAEHKENPLNAIAGTFFINENLIPFVKEIKRQGDVMLVELTENVKPSGNKVPLTKEQYFGWLTFES